MRYNNILVHVTGYQRVNVNSPKKFRGEMNN